jgi:hypothetical protein
MLIEMADYSALYEDACLYIVPGSHKQPRTPEQRQKSSTQEAPKDPMDMPGALQVNIKRTSSATRLHCTSCVMALTRSSSRGDCLLQLQYLALRHLQPACGSCNFACMHG